MPKLIQIHVMTSEGQSLSDEATSIKAPGELGYLGILYNHAPLVSTVTPGQLTWRRPSGEERTLLIGSGLLEIARNQLTVLTESVAEPAASTRG